MSRWCCWFLVCISAWAFIEEHQYGDFQLLVRRHSGGSIAYQQRFPVDPSEDVVQYFWEDDDSPIIFEE